MWIVNTEICEKIQEVLAETQRVEKEIGIINSYQDEFSSIHSKFNNLYGKKYGINQKKVRRRVDVNELKRIMHLIRAEDAQPQKVGFLGLGGLKKEEYYVFTDKLNLVESNLAYMIDDWKRKLSDKADELRVLLDDYENSYKEDIAIYEAVSQSDIYEPLKENVGDIFLGTVTLKLPENVFIMQLFQNKVYSFQYDGGIHMLTKTSLQEFLPCYIQYETETELNDIYNWIRNLYKQLLMKSKAFHCELLYLDGLHNASGLKEFLRLQLISEEDREDIEEGICGNYLKILSVKRDKESICQELQSLEQYMGRITDLLQGETSFVSYNANHEKKIPYRIVVLEGLESYIDTTLLRKLLNNGSSCGVFTIYLQNVGMLKKDSSGIKGEYTEFTGLFANFPQLIFNKGNINLRQGSEIDAYTLLPELPQQNIFVNNVIEKLGIKKEVDNNFGTYFKEDYPWGQYASTEKTTTGNLKGCIKIPFAVNKHGRLVSLELGSADYAHGLISGGTGSGKSTMLHMIINSVVMNYHPKDVEIWLADYKQMEMSVYINNKPPHIKFIGIERNEEFSFALIDLINKEYERRSRLFVEEGVRNIDAYKDKFGINSISRILVIIDEFHLMSQQVHENAEYATKLENILSEARTTGIVCLFADQAISVGLKGLTEKGKKQMRQRLSMANDREEMSIVLDVRITEEEAILKNGEVLQKKLITKADENGMQVRTTVLETNKVIYLTDTYREQVAKKAIELYGEDKTAIIVDGKQQARIDWEKTIMYEQKEAAIGDIRKKYYLHLGVPSNLESCYAIGLIKDYGQNIISIHSRNDLQRLVVMSSIQSFLRNPASKVYILADENDALYLSMRVTLQDLQKGESNLIVCSDMVAVCKNILELNDAMIERRKRLSENTELIIWFGLDSMLREFSYYDELPNARRNTELSYLAKERESIEQKMVDLFGDDFSEESVSQKKEDAEELLFNATEYVLNLIKDGAKRGIFQFVFTSNLLSFKNNKRLKLEYFTYKMSGFLNRDESIEFYGSSGFMRSMSEKEENISYVCYDGRKPRFFVPYKEEEI